MAVEGGLIVSTFGENFGQVIVGSASGQRQIIITNPGTNPNTVGPLAITTGGTNPTDFEVDTNTCAPNKTLLAGESCSIFVRFKPGTPGEKEALIGITAGTVTGQYIVILSGQAVEPKLTISAPGYANGELNFGAFPIGAFSDLRPVTITNSSTNAVTLDTDFPAGAGNFTVDQTACDGKTLGTNESCTLYVRFTPQAGPGEKFGTVTVDTAGLAGSYVITLHGTAVAPVLTVNTPVNGILDFGQKVINQSPSAPQSITITNNTGATLTGLTYIPNADPAFLIDNGTCGTTLTPGQSCTINVRFQPTTAGNKSGTIVIDGDNIDGSYNFFLYGVGIEPGLLITGPNLVNGQVDFGSQPIGSLSARQEIVVTNTTTGALTVNTNGINLLPFVSSNRVAAATFAAAASSLALLVQCCRRDQPDQRGVRQLAPEVADRGRAIYPRHQQIHQDHLGPKFTREAQPLGPSGSLTITSRSRSRPRTIRRPWRAKLWSSTSKIRIVIARPYALPAVVRSPAHGEVVLYRDYAVMEAANCFRLRLS